MTDELDRIPLEIEIATSTGERLLVKIITARNGRPRIAIAMQYLGRECEWKLRQSALVVDPRHVKRLVKAIERMAASINGGEG